MTAFKIAASAVLGYFLGSISFAVIMSKLATKRDIREFGSGNAGATNVARVLGMGFGVLTFVCDILKTAAAMLLGRLIGGDVGFAVSGAGCIFGHCFPLMFHFRGGKGVTVGAAIAIMLDWRLFLALLLIFIIGFAVSKRVSVGSIADGAAFPFVMLLLGERDALRLGLGVLVMLVVVFMHHGNIKRLLHGQEPRFVPKSKGK